MALSGDFTNSVEAATPGRQVVGEIAMSQQLPLRQGYQPAQLRFSKADMGITVGETYDVEYQMETPGLADLEIRETSFPTPVTLPLTFSEAK